MSKKNPPEPQISDAQAAARMLGAKGGQTRAKNLSKKERSEIARLGGLARHGIREQPKELPKPRAAKVATPKRSRKVRTAA